MIRLISLVFFLNIGTFLFGQIGIDYAYLNQSYPEWTQLLIDNQVSNSSEKPVFQNAHRIGIEYWLRIPNYRVEFFPQINITRQLSSYINNIQTITLESHVYGIDLKTQIYFLDFHGDCDCPTFSNNEPIIKKGTYFIFSPGAYIFSGQINQTTTGIQLVAKELNSSFRLGLGLGIDIGINDLFSISPYYKYEIHRPFSWDELGTIPLSQGGNDQSSTSTKMTGHVTGVKLNIRFNR